MIIPDHLARYPTAKAIDALARRFHLPNEPWMQDWEYQVADASCLDEFIAAYRSCELEEDERFVLMQIILGSLDDLGAKVLDDPRLATVADLIEADIEMHIYSVWYWSCTDTEGQPDDDPFYVTPRMRAILHRHKTRFGIG